MADSDTDSANSQDENDGRSRDEGRPGVPVSPRPHRGRRAALVFVVLWFVLGGIAHFALTEAEMRIVPPSIPWPRAAVLVSGVCELLGAAGLLWQPTRRAAGVGLLLLTLAVTPANVYMLQHAAAFPVPRWALVLRLPLQAVLVGLIAWSSWARGPVLRAPGRLPIRTPPPT